jgi:hypothetical protein
MAVGVAVGQVSQALVKLEKAVSELVWHGHSTLMAIHGQLLRKCFWGERL